MSKTTNFHELVDNYQDLIDKNTDNLNSSSEYLVCECNFIDLDTVLRKMTPNTTKNGEDFSELIELVGLGRGCGSCTKKECLKEIYIKYVKKN